jgi:two-component system sensor histidine kinase BaeS
VKSLVRALVILIAVVVLALLAAEATMQPSAHDRLVLLGIFAAVGALVAVAAGVLPRLAARLSSLHTVVIVISVAAVAAAATAIVASAASMFISAHDLRLVLVALGLGVALGIVLASAIARPLQDDLHRIRDTAQRVAVGDRDVRTGVVRADEVGALAAALDGMIDRLAVAEADRARMEAARREFLAAVGHDLRTPLTSLRAAVEALQDGLADDPDRYLAAMRTDVRLLSSLVDDLFLLSRIESGGLSLDRETIDLAELADDAVEAMRPIADRRNVSLLLDTTGPVAVHASPREIGRVIRNLLDNAVRHTPRGSAVTVAIDADGTTATLRIQDEGDGFPADMVERAFESFTRADEARRRDGSGAGLGLAIARGLVTAHGGTIRALPGPGGQVEVTLPARRTDRTATAP